MKATITIQGNEIELQQITKEVNLLIDKFFPGATVSVQTTWKGNIFNVTKNVTNEKTNL